MEIYVQYKGLKIYDNSKLKEEKYIKTFPENRKCSEKQV